MKKLNIVFMGTPNFSATILKALTHHHNVIAVYTRTNPTDLTKPPVNIYADENNIKVFTPKSFKLDITVEEFKALNPDILIVAAYGAILPQTILDIPRLGAINIHPSLLPNYRGANPIQRAIINGDKKTGVTIMKMDAGMDTGDMLIKEEVELDDKITYGELDDKLATIGADLIIKYLENMETITPEKQPEEFTLAQKFTKDEAKINWEKTATEIHNLVRGLQPYPSAHFTHNNTIIKIINSEVINETTSEPAGTLLDKDFKIACGNNTVLKINIIQKQGGKPMDIKSFVNGYKIAIGEILK